MQFSLFTIEHLVKLSILQQLLQIYFVYVSMRVHTHMYECAWGMDIKVFTKGLNVIFRCQDSSLYFFGNVRHILRS